MTIPADAVRAYHDTGHLVREGLVGVAELERLRRRLNSLATELGRREFDEGEGGPEGMLERYLGSKFGVGAFWDPTLPSPAELPPERRVERIHRIGHGVHSDPELAPFLHEGAMAEVAAELLGGPVIPVQALFMVKPVGSEIVFVAHTDGAYIRAEPAGLVVAWLALDDTDEHNGGVEVVRLGAEGERVLLPLAAGSAGFWTGETVHASAANRSAAPRRALIAYYVHAGARYEVEPCRPE